MSAGTKERDLVAIAASDAADARRSPRPRAPLVKASFNIPADELESLKELADRRQTTATQVIRHALTTELYIQKLVDQRAEIFAHML